jgi:hypothetical protein
MDFKKLALKLEEATNAWGLPLGQRPEGSGTTAVGASSTYSSAPQKGKRVAASREYIKKTYGINSPEPTAEEEENEDVRQAIIAKFGEGSQKYSANWDVYTSLVKKQGFKNPPTVRAILEVYFGQKYGQDGRDEFFLKEYGIRDAMEKFAKYIMAYRPA